jgi:aminoglycoside phosphotransferase (APT) family kinase protein
MRDTVTMPSILETFLSGQGGAGQVKVVGYELMTGGYSRVMAKVTLAWPDGRQELVVLRGDPPPEEAFLVTDRDREWAILRRLTSLPHIPAPAARWYVDDPSLFGTKAILVDYVDAPSLQCRIDGGLEPSPMLDPIVDLAAAVASTDVQQLPPELGVTETWDRYMDGLIRQWRQLEDAFVESSPTVRYVGAWLDTHRPPPLPLRLQHGDFQAANMLLSSDGLQLVDWELAHVGDPREDLGWYHVYSASAPPNLYALDPEGFLARYRARTGFSEAGINRHTVAYFSILAPVKIIAGIYQSIGAMALGQAGGTMISFNLLAALVAHQNWLTLIQSIEAAQAGVAP